MKKDLRVDSKGNGPEYHPGEKVYHAMFRKHATVIEQLLNWDYPDQIWGSVLIVYDNDSVQTTVSSWQLSRVIT